MDMERAEKIGLKTNKSELSRGLDFCVFIVYIRFYKINSERPYFFLDSKKRKYEEHRKTQKGIEE